MKTYKAESRKDWGTSADNVTLEQINTGAILRIADATEAMAKNHIALIRDRDYYERQYKLQLDRAQSAERRIAALQGVITKMKKAKALEPTND